MPCATWPPLRVASSARWKDVSPISPAPRGKPGALRAYQVHEFRSLVKVDHVIYKQRAYMALTTDGDPAYTEPVAVDHHKCRLGTWYESTGRAEFGDTRAYAALATPHARVHGSAHKLLSTWAGLGKGPGMQMQMFNAMKDAEDASHEVMDLIDRMVVEKHGEAG